MVRYPDFNAAFARASCCSSEQAAARDVAAAEAFQRWALIVFCLLRRSMDTETNIYLCMLISFEDSAKAQLAALAPAQVRAVNPRSGTH